MDRDKIRKGIYAIAGVYLLYTAWQLFQGLDETENKMLMTAFTILFVIMGVALIAWSAWSMYKENAQGSASKSDRGEENSVNVDSASEENIPKDNELKDNKRKDNKPGDDVSADHALKGETPGPADQKTGMIKTKTDEPLI